jgi:hypothetical protein
MKESTTPPYYAKIRKIGEEQILEVELGNRTLPEGFSSKYRFCQDDDPDKTAYLELTAGFGYIHSQSQFIELSIYPLNIQEGKHSLCPYHEPDE